MATKFKKRKTASRKKRFIGKPNGQIQERVRAVTPEDFSVASVDCAKRRSKWMLCNFYGMVVHDLQEAFVWLPKSAYADEAKPLAALIRPKRRGPQRLGELLVPLLVRLGVGGEEVGVGGQDTFESNTSEARSPAD